MSNSIENLFKKQDKFYIKILKETPIYQEFDGHANERWVVEGQTYEVLSQNDKWYKIKFGSKYGWIQKDKAEKMDCMPYKRIMVAWDYVSNKNDNTTRYDGYISIKSSEIGLDVISPTWFTRRGRSDESDSIKVVEKCDREYVRRAHRNGYEIWGLIADFDAERNYAVYSNDNLVEREIRDIVNYALEYELDGINIDFEGFGSRCREFYNKYVERLSKELKKHNIVVSIDVTKESNSDAWGKCYDRREISRHVDYVAYMAYDEHGRLDVIPGSTGSLPWVEEGIVQLLNMGIPTEKILLGVPYYTRDWKVQKIVPKVKSVLISSWEGIGLYEMPSKVSDMIKITPGSLYEYFGEEDNWYRVKYKERKYYVPKSICTVLNPGDEIYKAVKVDPLAMKDIEKIDGKVEYDFFSGQKKIIYEDEEGFSHFIWVEDNSSIEKRLKLVEKYNLSGAAAWALNQENAEIWKVVRKILKAWNFSSQQPVMEYHRATEEN